MGSALRGPGLLHHPHLEDFLSIVSLGSTVCSVLLHTLERFAKVFGFPGHLKKFDTLNSWVLLLLILKQSNAVCHGRMIMKPGQKSNKMLINNVCILMGYD